MSAHWTDLDEELAIALEELNARYTWWAMYPWLPGDPELDWVRRW